MKGWVHSLGQFGSQKNVTDLISCKLGRFLVVPTFICQAPLSTP